MFSFVAFNYSHKNKEWNLKYNIMTCEKWKMKKKYLFFKLMCMWNLNFFLFFFLKFKSIKIGYKTSIETLNTCEFNFKISKVKLISLWNFLK